MPTQTTQAQLWPKLFRAEGKGQFFEVFANLDADLNKCKIRFQIFEYDEQTRKKKCSVHHNVDLHDYLYLAYLIRTGRLGSYKERGQGGKGDYAEHKGWPDAKYSTGHVAHVLSVSKEASTKDTKYGQDRFATPWNVLFVKIDVGPGEPAGSQQGAVKPAKATDGFLSCRFTMNENIAIQMVEAVQLYLNGWISQNFAAIQAKMVERDNNANTGGPDQTSTAQTVPNAGYTAPADAHEDSDF